MSYVIAQQYGEAPVLAERVAAGEIPPVEERLPVNPLVVPVVERIGDYGGTWRTALVGGGDTAWLQRTIAYDYLLRWDPEWTQPIPNIAESIEANEDATEYIIRLREGMRWSDGHPFTADDIMFWYEDVLMNTELTPAEPRNAPTVEKLDDYAVRFSFAEPRGLFPQELAAVGASAYTRYPRHYAEQFHISYNPEGIDALVAEAGVQDWLALFQQRFGDEGRWQNPDLPTLYAWRVTTPYDGSSTRFVVERNPYYFKVDPEGNQLPYIDSVVYDILDNPEVLLLRTMAGEIDLHARHINNNANRAVLFDNMDRGDYRFINLTSARNTAIIFINQTHKDPVKREVFQNKDFRIGLSHAINRQEIIDLVHVGQGEPYQVAPRSDMPLYNEQLATQYLEYNVDIANQHLDAAGYSNRDAEGFRLGPDGNRITIIVELPTGYRQDMVDATELIIGYWREVGIDAHMRTMDRSLFTSRKEANEHDVAVFDADGGGVAVLLRPHPLFPYDNESSFAPAWAAWYNPNSLPNVQPEEPPAATRRQMELYDELIRTADVDEQNRLMSEIYQIAADEFYLIGISLPAAGYAIAQNSLHNIPQEMPDSWQYPTPAPTNPEQYFLEAGSQ